jgi:hypothetical protein
MIDGLSDDVLLLNLVHNPEEGSRTPGAVPDIT